MNDNVESHELPEGWVIEPQHLSIVSTIVKGWVSLRNDVLIFIAIVIYDSCYS